MGIFGFERKEVYEMCQEQYDEIIEFYKSLDLSSKQAKELAGNCFGSKVVVSKNAPYRDDWEFYRHIQTPPIKKTKNMKNGGRAKITESFVEEACCEPEMMAMPMMSQAMASQPMMRAMMSPQMPGMMGMAGNAAQFNTARTKTVDEAEESTPLDKPQTMFSANVNTASWSYVRACLLRGRRIDPDFVRMEEIINSYRFKLKKPENDELFAISAEHTDCPWDKDSELLLIGLKAKKADKKVPQHLTLLVDVSGSMTDEWILVQMSMMAIISNLGKGDEMSIIAYSDNTVTVAERMSCENMDKCIKAVLSIDGIGGCTNGSEGLTNAYRYLSDNYDPEANNRIFIFTDGDFNFGITSEGGLAGFIKEKRDTGIYLSIVGYGMSNFKDDNMESLARNGNGNYTFIGHPDDIIDNLHEKLISNLVTVAKDVKISVELNPMLVSSYRLLGYDARALTRQEFEDTEKATDGIGSKHNVAAVVQYKRGKAEQLNSSRYVTSQASSDSDEFGFVEVRYKTPEGENKVMTHTITPEEASGSTSNAKVAALLAAFGLLVKDSKYKGSCSKEMLSELIGDIEKDESIKLKKKYGHLEVLKKYIS